MWKNKTKKRKRFLCCFVACKRACRICLPIHLTARLLLLLLLLSGEERVNRERESQSGVVAKNRIWWPLQNLHCLDLLFLPPPRLTLVFCLTLSFPILYIYFLFFFSLFTYLFIYFLYFLCFRSVATTEYISSFLSTSNLPYYRGRRERRAYTLTPPFCFYLGRDRHTDRQTSGKRDRTWVQGWFTHTHTYCRFLLFFAWSLWLFTGVHNLQQKEKERQ